MAFPVVSTKNTFTSAGVSATQHTLTYPTGIQAGDLLIMFAALDGANVTATWSGPSYTRIVAQTSGGAGSQSLDTAYKIASGSESGTFLLDLSASEQLICYHWRITGWHGTTPPEGTPSSGNDANPDAPSETPSWGAGDTLWVAFAATNNGNLSVFPTNYNDNQAFDNSGGSGIADGAVASRNLNAASDDPGTYTNDIGIQPWAAATIAVRSSDVSGPAPLTGVVHSSRGSWR